ncbi:MAG: hypothetical protein ACOC4M_06155 [Promethearchaeia archaeon]
MFKRSFDLEGLKHDLEEFVWQRYIFPDRSRFGGPQTGPLAYIKIRPGVWALSKAMKEKAKLYFELWYSLGKQFKLESLGDFLDALNKILPKGKKFKAALQLCRRRIRLTSKYYESLKLGIEIIGTYPETNPWTKQFKRLTDAFKSYTEVMPGSNRF